jgi:hypothetical protein
LDNATAALSIWLHPPLGLADPEQTATYCDGVLNSDRLGKGPFLLSPSHLRIKERRLKMKRKFNIIDLFECFVAGLISGALIIYSILKLWR